MKAVGSRYAPEERESIIRWDQTGDPAAIWTCDPVLRRRLEAAGIAPDRVEGEGAAYTVPKGWLRIRVAPPRQALARQRAHLAAIRRAGRGGPEAPR
ncbi:MAG: hypothetical protein K6V97_03440 [Actinomycetia bacterium]|nr:hypothetical protein [Actinomycetes bacterium]